MGLKTNYRYLQDSLHVVHLVSKEVSRLHHYANLLEQIRMYLDKE